MAVEIRIDPPFAGPTAPCADAIVAEIVRTGSDVALATTQWPGRLADLIALGRGAAPRSIRLVVEPADDLHDVATAAAGYRRVRELHQLRRPLPLERSLVAQTSAIPTRPFVPGRDEAAWLAVNNRAFAWHEDQSEWTERDVMAREAEPWFDPDGFLLHERDGRLAGFCWTKIHADHDPPLGEIYVIGVDPDFRGLGLGRALTVAGLEHLAAAGLTVGMLYVEATNAPALALYRSLGFRVHHHQRHYLSETATAR